MASDKAYLSSRKMRQGTVSAGMRQKTHVNYFEVSVLLVYKHYTFVSYSTVELIALGIHTGHM
jgi:hypothetical protein